MKVSAKFIIYTLMFSLTMIAYMDRIVLSVAAPRLVAEFSLSPVQLGYLLSSFGWSYLLTLIPWGLAFDRFETRRTSAVGVALFAFATMASGLTGSFFSLLITRLVMGIGEASAFPVNGKVIREWIPPRERGFAFTLQGAGPYVGPAVGALLAAAIIEAAGWRAAFLVIGFLGLIWLAFWMALYNSPERSHLLNETQRAVVLAEARVEIDKFANTATRSGLGGLLRSRTMWGVMFTQALNGYTLYLFLTWLPTYLKVTKGLSIKGTGLFTAIPYLGAAILIIAYGRLSDRFLRQGNAQRGDRRISVAVTLFSAAVILLLPWVRSLAAIEIILMLSLAGTGACAALNQALVIDLLPNKADASTAIGMVIAAGVLFAIVAPIATGYIVSLTGSYDLTFNIAGILLVAGGLNSLLLTRRPIATCRTDGPEAQTVANYRAVSHK